MRYDTPGFTVSSMMEDGFSHMKIDENWIVEDRYLLNITGVKLKGSLVSEDNAGNIYILDSVAGEEEDASMQLVIKKIYV